MYKLVLVLHILPYVQSVEDHVLKRLDRLENMQKVLISTVRYQRGQIQHLEDTIELLQEVQFQITFKLGINN